MSQFSGFLLVGFQVAPGLFGVQNFLRDAWYFVGDLHLENRVSVGFHIVQLAAEYCGDHRARQGQINAFTNSESAARPASVEQPNLRTVFCQALGKQFSINRRLQGQEGRSKAGGESCLRFISQTAFSARKFGGVAAQEVVHRLGVAELCQRRHHAESVGSQEKYMARVTAHAGRFVIRDEL